ncbi:hypothetical protein PG993_006769 [Apiospora rasikravindrae]|uniref:Uncharacterized protein n=1 Tax=Apiospora rasikravindrae TaxID=990691 RepID=A0ABR1T8A3_9PEZI
MNLLQMFYVVFDLFKLLTTWEWIEMLKKLDYVVTAVFSSEVTKSFFNNPPFITLGLIAVIVVGFLLLIRYLFGWVYRMIMWFLSPVFLVGKIIFLIFLLISCGLFVQLIFHCAWPEAQHCPKPWYNMMTLYRPQFFQWFVDWLLTRIGLSALVEFASNVKAATGM